jgi:peptide/nickel transport system substrate-binding protein
MIQAIVGMWRKVGIDAEIEVYEIAKHYELRAGTSSRRWRSTTGATRSAIRRPRPVSRCSPLAALGLEVERSRRQIGPLWGEKDEAKRIAGWKAVDKYIAEKGYVIPLVQYSQPIVFKASISR